ncbi:hypothetical protein GCM10009827_016140 [Dactylosporangium maewongense]|uniref:NACHT domain-containing protein n=1 Tax=Dactylosporangium maewongense TaxID=634393 RepID=A0ABN1ZSS4_9ACTN
MVAVAQSASDSARQLADALDALRDPHAGALTGAQRDALKRLTDALKAQPGTVVADILSRASLRILNLDPGSGEAAAAEGLLDGYVVQPGQGRAAFDLLAAAHRERAARRSGLDLDGWIKTLERGHLGLLVDADGSRAARRGAELAALGRYCERLTHSSRTIDLLSLGVELPPIEAIELTDVTPDPSGSSSQRSVDLDLALRRHGRVLLLGAPGSGKSTMLRWLAGREAERRWSTPALIDLRALLQLRNGSLTALLDVGPEPVDTLVDIALASAPHEDRDMLAVVLRSAAADGSLLVCLDSLDETREHRHAVVAWIRRLIGRLNPGCDIVLATRTSAYAAAATLGWHEVWVAPPGAAEPLVRTILDAFAAHNRRDAGWVQTRNQWVAADLEHSPQLGDTPLLLTALTVEAARRVTSEHAPGRAKLIETIVERVAANWERGSSRIGVELPRGLHSTQVTDALRSAIQRLSWAVVVDARGVPRESIERHLTALLAREHDLATGRARALAASTVHFWDEAGIIALDERRYVTSRVRHVVEVMAARHLAELPATGRQEALAIIAAEPTTIEVLTLLAALDEHAASDVVEVAIANGNPELLFAAASGLADNANVHPESSRLIDALSAIESDDEIQNARIALHLVNLPMASTDHDRLPAIIDSLLPAAAARVWRALLSDRLNDLDATAGCMAVVLEGPPPRPQRPPHLTGLDAILFHDDTAWAFGQVVLAAARRLTNDDHELAERILNLAYSNCPRAISSAIYTELSHRGFPSDPPQKASLDWSALSAHDERFDTALERLLRYLEKPDPQRDLTTVDRRRLHQLSRLMDGLAIGEGQIGEFENVANRHEADLLTLVDALLDHGDFDRDMLAAEAASFLDEFRQNHYAWLFLTYDSPSCHLRRWEGAPLGTFIASISLLLERPLWLAVRAARVMIQVPANSRQDVAAAAARTAESRSAPRQRQVAASVALLIDTVRYLSQWRYSSDPVLRAAIMRRANAMPDRTTILIEGVQHPDVLVRAEAIEALTVEDVGQPAVADALRHAKRMPDRGTCRYCGLQFTERTTNCDKCGLALPDPRPEIERLLLSAEWALTHN